MPQEYAGLLYLRTQEHGAGKERKATVGKNQGSATTATTATTGSAPRVKGPPPPSQPVHHNDQSGLGPTRPAPEEADRVWCVLKNVAACTMTAERAEIMSRVWWAWRALGCTYDARIMSEVELMDATWRRA
jgi:hypothetical protein